MSAAQPSPPTAGCRGPSRQRLLWGVALGAPLLAAAWGAANWKTYHLAHCRRRIYSGDELTQARGLHSLGKVHIRPGADRAEVERVLASVGLVMRLAPHESPGPIDRYVIGFADPDQPRFIFWALVQIEDGRFVGISTCH